MGLMASSGKVLLSLGIFINPVDSYRMSPSESRGALLSQPDLLFFYVLSSPLQQD